MIYTIGHKKSYDDGLEEYKDQFRKLGKTNDYEGGIVFQTYDDAAKYIVTHNLFDFAVYGLVADWSDDCQDSRLINTSQIVRAKSR